MRIMKTMRHKGEFGFIAALERQLRYSKRVICGIGDDAAVVAQTRKYYQLYTTDMLIEGAHFLRAQPAAAIGHKALACSLSDIAAMGGQPEYALVSLGVPADLPYAFVSRLYAGMKRTARMFDVDIIGGDTNQAERITIAVFLSGRVERRYLTLRSGARPGDRIFVTGRIGGSAAGAHLRFTPRIREARFLVAHVPVHAMIDVSDGLLQDLGHITQRSSNGAQLFLDQVPCRRGVTPVAAITSGEDFELLFTVPRNAVRRLRRIWPFRAQTPLQEIGRIVDAWQGVRVFDAAGRCVRISGTGYRHF